MKPLSIFGRVVGLALLVLAVAMGISLALLLLVPPPSPGRMNVEDMVWALEAKPSFVIDTRVRDEPPTGRRSRVLEATLAQALDVPSSDVRAVWTGEPEVEAGQGESIMIVGGREVLVSSTASDVTLSYGSEVSLSRRTIIPLFIGAVKIADGEWRWGFPHDQAREEWLWRILAAFLAATVVLAAPVWWIARRLVAPIEKLGERAEVTRLTGQDPFPIAGPKEVQATARAMNIMHNRLVNQASERVRMIAAIAHDLRTPITALRLRVNAVEEPLRGRMSSDLARMSAMTGELLEFARIGGRTPQIRQVDLSALVNASVANRRDAGGDVTMETGARPVLPTDPELVSRAVENLIDNAVRYGGRTKVSVSVHGEWAHVNVEDDGPGIPSHLHERAKMPFERLDLSRNREQGGTGLGLSIVGDIAQVLGGRFEMANREPGLLAVLELPLGGITEGL